MKRVFTLDRNDFQNGASRRRLGWVTFLVVATSVVLGILPVSPVQAAGSEEDPGRPDPSLWEGWLQGASGMLNAIDRIGSEKKPMAVYFYTDWCPYCRQFENELLSAPEVQSYFRDLVCVRINPEAGPEEAEMARLYGVSGYPAFFVHSNQSKAFTRVNRMTLKDGRPTLMEGGEFVDAVRRAAQR